MRRPTDAQASRGFATGWRRRLCAALVVTATATFVSPLPAMADDGSGVSLFGGTNIGIGPSGDSFGLVGPDAVSGLVDSSYSLSDLDPVTGAVTSADVTAALTDDYALSADLSGSSLLALDTAELARRAQEQADAKRRAMATSGTGALKPGTVPAPYDALITDAVTRFCPALPPSILAAQLKQESGFNPRARSPKDARGIAQFIPGTWASSGVDGNGDGRRDVWDPEDAIPAAAAYDCAIRKQVRNVPGDPDANMLAGYNAGPGRVLQFNGVPPYPETQAYVRRILASAETFAGEGADGATSQTTVGPDGCPTRAPSNTLRDGSARVGIAKICADSVARARTPQAAIAIKYALSHLGAPYSQARRNEEGYYDCSSFTSRAYRAAGLKFYTGNAWVVSTFKRANWVVKIPYSQARPGDLVAPVPGHIAMTLAGGWKVHTNMTGDVSKVERAYSKAYWTGRVDPSRM